MLKSSNNVSKNRNNVSLVLRVYFSEEEGRLSSQPEHPGRDDLKLCKRHAELDSASKYQ